MGRECAYSFRDLYQAAHGHPMSQLTEQDLYRITQEQRNQWVAEWAELAGWETQPRAGTDGLIYLAFCPAFDGGKAA